MLHLQILRRCCCNRAAGHAAARAAARPAAAAPTRCAALQLPLQDCFTVCWVGDDHLKRNGLNSADRR
jgi:hypothetical protein